MQPRSIRSQICEIGAQAVGAARGTVRSLGEVRRCRPHEQVTAQALGLAAFERVGDVRVDCLRQRCDGVVRPSVERRTGCEKSEHLDEHAAVFANLLVDPSSIRAGRQLAYGLSLDRLPRMNPNTAASERRFVGAGCCRFLSKLALTTTRHLNPKFNSPSRASMLP